VHLADSTKNEDGSN